MRFGMEDGVERTLEDLWWGSTIQSYARKKLLLKGQGLERNHVLHAAFFHKRPHRHGANRCEPEGYKRNEEQLGEAAPQVRPSFETTDSLAGPSLFRYQDERCCPAH